VVAEKKRGYGRVEIVLKGIFCFKIFDLLYRVHVVNEVVVAVGLWNVERSHGNSKAEGKRERAQSSF
jgi:hypothetical protein